MWVWLSLLSWVQILPRKRISLTCNGGKKSSALINVGEIGFLIGMTNEEEKVPGEVVVE